VKFTIQNPLLTITFSLPPSPSTSHLDLCYWSLIDNIQLFSIVITNLVYYVPKRTKKIIFASLNSNYNMILLMNESELCGGRKYSMTWRYFVVYHAFERVGIFVRRMLQIWMLFVCKLKDFVCKIKIFENNKLRKYLLN
jgi:hypothetical protein